MNIYFQFLDVTSFIRMIRQLSFFFVFFASIFSSSYAAAETDTIAVSSME